MVKIKYFGVLKSCLPEVESDGFWHAEKAGATISEVLEETGAVYEGTKVLLVNRVRKTEDYVLQDGDTLTVMPLMAGG